MVIYGIDKSKTVQHFEYTLGNPAGTYGKGPHRFSGAGFPEDVAQGPVTYEAVYHDGTRSSVSREEIEAYDRARSEKYDADLQRERKARLIEVERLFLKVQGVALALGNWRVVDERHAEHQDVANFSLRCGSGDAGPRVGVTVNREGRLSLSGLAPDGISLADWDGFRITLAVGKTPAQVAKEIERRILPKYLPAFAEAGKQAHVHGLAIRKAEEMARELAAAFGSNAHLRAGDWTVWASRDDWGAVTVRVSPGTPENPLYRVEGSLQPGALAALAKSFPRLKK